MTLSEHQFAHVDLTVNGITLHTVSAGEGPLDVFCHGFPESWYSWRHQLPAVAAAGFRAIAALSVPYQAPTGCLPEGLTIGDLMRAKASDADYYRLYVQEPGVADAEIKADLESFLRGFLYGVRGEGHTPDARRGAGRAGRTDLNTFRALAIDQPCILVAARVNGRPRASRTIRRGCRRAAVQGVPNPGNADAGRIVGTLAPAQQARRMISGTTTYPTNVVAAESSENVIRTARENGWCPTRQAPRLPA